MFAAGRPAARSAYLCSRCKRNSHVRKSWSEPVFLLTQERLRKRNGPGTWIRVENYRTLEFTNLLSISPQSGFLGCCFFRLVCKHPKFGEFFSVSWFSVLLVALLDRGKFSCTRPTKMANRRSNSFGKHLRIRSHESNTKTDGL